jgi:hypothetical protein
VAPSSPGPPAALLLGWKPGFGLGGVHFRGKKGAQISIRKSFLKAIQPFGSRSRLLALTRSDKGNELEALGTLVTVTFASYPGMLERWKLTL